MRWRRGETAKLRRDARRDPATVEISGYGATETPRIRQCYADFEASVGQERLAATRAVGPMLDQLLRLAPELVVARHVLDSAFSAAAVEPTAVGVLPGEESMPPGLQHRRQEEDRRRRAGTTGEEVVRAAAVHASLQARVDVLAERIRARVRLAQAAGMAAHYKAVAQIDYYAKHLVRHHSEGATLVRIGWPQPHREPMPWLTDDRAALHLICGSASWLAHTSEGELS